MTNSRAALFGCYALHSSIAARKKINVEEIFKHLAPNTKVRVI
jgi:hypothetical protein